MANRFGPAKGLAGVVQATPAVVLILCALWAGVTYGAEMQTAGALSQSAPQIVDTPNSKAITASPAAGTNSVAKSAQVGPPGSHPIVSPGPPTANPPGRAALHAKPHGARVAAAPPKDAPK
jgi:hypothetical protein